MWNLLSKNSTACRERLDRTVLSLTDPEENWLNNDMIGTTGQDSLPILSYQPCHCIVTGQKKIANKTFRRLRNDGKTTASRKRPRSARSQNYLFAQCNCKRKLSYWSEADPNRMWAGSYPTLYLSLHQIHIFHTQNSKIQKNVKNKEKKNKTKGIHTLQRNHEEGKSKTKSMT